MERRSARELYFREAMRYMTKLVTLLDRNPFRPTYGCFDREFWHYKTSDFPCTMYQSNVLSLALFYLTESQENVLCQNQNVFEWINASLSYTAKIAHSDGSGDDYYPFERALGAVTYSLYADTETCLLLDIRIDELLEFFKKRARWISRHYETGVLSNHHATSVVSLYNTYLLTGEPEFKDLALKKLQETLSYQSGEGWFLEYDGCDPGYNSITIDFLAKYVKKSGDDSIIPALEKSIRFSRYFMHPDGSYGGIYGSRDTCQFLPHGFEILAPRIPEAAWMCERFLEGINKLKQGRWDDDRVFNHHLDNYLQAYRDYADNVRIDDYGKDNFERYFPESGLVVSRKKPYYFVVSLKKGGCLRLFKDRKEIHAETGLITECENGDIAVTHFIDKKVIEKSGSLLKISGSFNRADYNYSSIIKLILFRAGLSVLGRTQLGSRLVRRILQQMLIVGKRKLPLQFERTLELGDCGLRIFDRMFTKRSTRLKRLFVGPDYTSIYTAVGDVFQSSVLLDNEDFSSQVERFNQAGEVSITRNFE